MLVTAAYARNWIKEDAWLDATHRDNDVPQIIGIDANAHHQIWDSLQSADEGGVD